MKNRRFALVASLLATAAFGSALTGCTGAQKTSISHLRSRLTPELTTLGYTSHEVYNNLAVARNQHFRALPEDIGRLVLYVDRPTRLTPAPVAH
ncbi:MAG: hypothetical protein D6695_09675 [Planctomycetota bacterium]|nr:MAG: hypothetical protein D6695_09675 [Planctomycetota bacterium]